LGKSRIDFLFTRGDGICWVETKSITLVENGTAKFPDAPTKRGRNHLEGLTDAATKGDGASVVFVVQRHDAGSFQPNWSIDPEFSSTLVKSASEGVKIRANICLVNLESIEFSNEIPCNLSMTRGENHL